MKTMTLFDLGYLDLIRSLFFGKKIRLVSDERPHIGRVPSVSGQDVRHVEPDEVHGDTGWTVGLPGHHPYPTPDLFNQSRD